MGRREGPMEREGAGLAGEQMKSVLISAQTPELTRGTASADVPGARQVMSIPTKASHIIIHLLHLGASGNRPYTLAPSCTWATTSVFVLWSILKLIVELARCATILWWTSVIRKLFPYPFLGQCLHLCRTSQAVHQYVCVQLIIVPLLVNCNSLCSHPGALPNNDFG